VVHDGKPRLISAAPFRDRVVHHAVTRVLEPIFERRFSPCSFACRKRLGTHKALGSARAGMERFEYVLKCDVRKYFASIDHDILNGLLARVIKCRNTLKLAAQIVAGWRPSDEPELVYFAGDDLFSPLLRKRGLPLGNQTSQFFANVYLDPLDQWMTRTARARRYVRYVDDFLVFGDSKAALTDVACGIEKALSGLRLCLHAGKSRVYRSRDGVPFLGWLIFPGRARLDRRNVVQFRRRMRRLQEDFAAGEIELDQVQHRVRAWIAHAAHGNTMRLRERLLEQFAFVRGRAVSNARGRVEQRCHEPAGDEP
jgi:hypothetical protein